MSICWPYSLVQAFTTHPNCPCPSWSGWHNYTEGDAPLQFKRGTIFEKKNSQQSHSHMSTNPKIYDCNVFVTPCVGIFCEWLARPPTAALGSNISGSGSWERSKSNSPWFGLRTNNTPINQTFDHLPIADRTITLTMVSRYNKNNNENPFKIKIK